MTLMPGGQAMATDRGGTVSVWLPVTKIELITEVRGLGDDCDTVSVVGHQLAWIPAHPATFLPVGSAHSAG